MDDKIGEDGEIDEGFNEKLKIKEKEIDIILEMIEMRIVKRVKMQEQRREKKGENKYIEIREEKEWRMLKRIEELKKSFEKEIMSKE